MAHLFETDLIKKVLEIHHRLCVAYECPVAYFHSLDPLSELVSSLLSHRTRNADSGSAFKALRAPIRTGPPCATRPRPTSRTTISAVTWPEQKAPRIQQILRGITERRNGDLSLDFLADMQPTDARAWLETLSGVAPKTSAAVLSFSTLRRPALPVDSHHHRVAVRTGIIPATLAVGPAHAVLSAQLPEDWDAQRIYDNHEVMMLHGQRCCYFRILPAGAALLDLCPTGQRRRTSGHRTPDKNPGDRSGRNQRCYQFGAQLLSPLIAFDDIAEPQAVHDDLVDFGPWQSLPHRRADLFDRFLIHGACDRFELRLGVVIDLQRAGQSRNWRAHGALFRFRRLSVGRRRRVGGGRGHRGGRVTHGAVQVLHHEVADRAAGPVQRPAVHIDGAPLPLAAQGIKAVDQTSRHLGRDLKVGLRDIDQPLGIVAQLVDHRLGQCRRPPCRAAAGSPGS